MCTDRPAPACASHQTYITALPIMSCHQRWQGRTWLKLVGEMSVAVTRTAKDRMRGMREAPDLAGMEWPTERGHQE